jgi:hypothetical protein
MKSGHDSYQQQMGGGQTNQPALPHTNPGAGSHIEVALLQQQPAEMTAKYTAASSDVEQLQAELAEQASRKQDQVKIAVSAADSKALQLEWQVQDLEKQLNRLQQKDAGHKAEIQQLRSMVAGRDAQLAATNTAEGLSSHLKGAAAMAEALVSQLKVAADAGVEAAAANAEAAAAAAIQGLRDLDPVFRGDRERRTALQDAADRLERSLTAWDQPPAAPQLLARALAVVGQAHQLQMKEMLRHLEEAQQLHVQQVEATEAATRELPYWVSVATLNHGEAAATATSAGGWPQERQHQRMRVAPRPQPKRWHWPEPPRQQPKPKQQQQQPLQGCWGQQQHRHRQEWQQQHHNRQQQGQWGQQQHQKQQEWRQQHHNRQQQGQWRQQQHQQQQEQGQQHRHQHQQGRRRRQQQQQQQHWGEEQTWLEGQWGPLT